MQWAFREYKVKSRLTMPSLTTSERGAVDEPVSGLSLGLIGSDGTSICHDDGESAAERDGRVGGGHL